MRYLLDTNAVSELTKPRPDALFREWAVGVRPGDTYISVLTVGELRRGVSALVDGRRRTLLESLNRRLIDEFSGRILPITAEIAARWGDVSGEAKLRGRAVAAVDGLIGATALMHEMTIVTRNVWDFDPVGCLILSPWTAPQS